MPASIGEILDTLTAPGELYETRPENTVVCHACGHRCKIREGRRGICQVRFNQGGELRVPYGYVAALQSDPIEKKPFFHVLPGSNALTFGMLGCDYHCPYCFTGDTMVVTQRGPKSLEECFLASERLEKQREGEIGFPSDLFAVAGSGVERKVKAVFKHPYQGEMVVIQPFYLPALKCTPDHKVYATVDANVEPDLVQAGDLTQDHYLAVPRWYSFSTFHKEEHYANEVARLLKSYFDVEAQFVNRATTLNVSVGKSSIGLLFKSLAGSRSSTKRVPEFIFESHKPIAKAFLEALVDGDGHRFENGKVSITTVSKRLAYGVAWLALKLGYLPSIYDTKMASHGTIQGRAVNRVPHQFSVVWYEDNSIRRELIETDTYYLVPIKRIERTWFDGFVFNMEVEEEHNYLANFCLVSNCQNWLTSQAMRDPASDVSVNYIRKVTPQQMVQLARRTQASVVVSSYNEPLITSEWAVAIFKEAKAAGLLCAYVSNGNNTPEVMEYLRPYLDAYKIDLKCMNDKNYRKLGGVLKNTLDGIRRAHELGLWVEVVTLVVPGFNDSNEELWEAARFLAGLSVDIPWHVTAFHKDYKMTDPENTDAKTLLRAAEIGREAGLRYVYAGNLPGQVGEYEDTFCQACNHRLIRRRGYVIVEYHITGDGKCPQCGTKAAGIWPKDPSQVTLNGWGIPFPVY